MGSRLYGYNPGAPVSGASQSGNLAISNDSRGGGSVQWYNGPNEDLGYVIGYPDTTGLRKVGGVTVGNAVGFMRTSVKTDAEFLSLANFLTSQGFMTASVAADWLNTNGYYTSWLSIVTPGLIMQLDANNSTSYPGAGTTVYDLTGAYNHTLSTATFTTLSGVKCFNENSGHIRVNGTGPTLPTSGYTYVTWARIKTSSSSWRTLFRTAPNDHPILVEINTDNLGFYDNDTPSFKDSGYDVTPIEDVWVQYSVVGDNSSSIFYINGAQVGTSVAFGAGGNRHDYWGLNGQEFGYLANLYLYNRKLTTTEILQNYNALKDRF